MELCLLDGPEGGMGTALGNVTKWKPEVSLCEEGGSFIFGITPMCSLEPLQNKNKWKRTMSRTEALTE